MATEPVPKYNGYFNKFHTLRNALQKLRTVAPGAPRHRGVVGRQILVLRIPHQVRRQLQFFSTSPLHLFNLPQSVERLLDQCLPFKSTPYSTFQTRASNCYLYLFLTLFFSFSQQGRQKKKLKKSLTAD